MKNLYKALCVIGSFGAAMIFFSMCIVLSAGFHGPTVVPIPEETIHFLPRTKQPGTTGKTEQTVALTESSAGSCSASETLPEMREETGKSTGKPEDTSAPATDPVTEPEEEHTQTETESVPKETENAETEPPVIPHTHSYTVTVTKDPTCTKNGEKRYVCSCGESRTETIPAAGHDMKLTEKYAPTTKSEGLEIYVCRVCGYKEEKKTEARLADASFTDTCSLNDLRCLPNTTTPDYDEALKLFLRRRADFKDEIPTLMTVSREFGAMYDWINVNSPSCCRYGLMISSGKQNETILYEPLTVGGEEADYFRSELAKNREAFAMEDEIIRQLKITSSTTQREAIERINDWMCANLYYDYDGNNADINVMLRTGGGICSTYSMIFNQLCHACGINCEFQMGFADDSSHSWNAIRFSDGSVYYVDTCWNDSQYRKKDGTIVDADVKNGVREAKVIEMRTRYLLLSYDEFAPTHHDVYVNPYY